MNKRLLILNGIAIIAVVANHASHIGFVAMFWWTDQYLPVTVPNFDQMGSISYYLLVAQQKLALFSVPSFLFASGGFIAYTVSGRESRLTRKTVENRVKGLLPPYLIWTLVFILAEIIVTGAKFTPLEFVLNLITIRHSPFFFVPLLIVYFLISLPLAYLAKYRWKILLTLAIIIQIGSMTYAYLRFTDFDSPAISIFHFLFSSQITEYFFFYALGLIVGLRFTNIKRALQKIRWPLLISTLIFAVLAVIEAEWVFQTYDSQGWRSVTLSLPTFLYALSFIFCFIALESTKNDNLTRRELMLLKDPPITRFFKMLGSGTLGIYLVHKSVLLVLPKIIYNVAPFVLGYQILFQPLLIAIAIAVPILMMYITNRLPIQKYYKIFFG